MTETPNDPGPAQPGSYSQQQSGMPSYPQQQYQAYSGGDNATYGGDPTLAEWWQRLLGYLIDAVVFVVILFILRALISAKGTGGLYLLGLIVYVLAFAYFAVQHAMYGQTLGKRVLGTMVVTADTRSKITGGTAAGRAAIFVFPGLIPLVGFLFWLLNVLWLTWDPKRQALHDKAVKTVVVKVSSVAGTGPQ